MKIIAIITIIGVILIFCVKCTEHYRKADEIAKLRDVYLKLGYHHVINPESYEPTRHESCKYIKPSRASGYWQCY